MNHIKLFIIVSFLFLSVPIHAADDTYFPDKVFFPERPDMNKFVSDWYCKHLNVLEEPSIYQQKSDKSKITIRFTWLRTFDNPIVLRLEINDKGSGTLFIKKSNGAGGYDPGKMNKNDKKEITKETVNAIIKSIKDTNFRGLPSIAEERGLDGSQWIIELLLHGNYHLVDRWSPASGPIRERGLSLIELSDLKVKKIY